MLPLFICALSLVSALGCGAAHMEQSAPRRVLITGFYDWKNLGDPPELERCHDNPSCRVLAGQGVGARGFRGPLARRLKARLEYDPHTRVDFELLPVTWGSASRLDRAQYELVIHLGLGVYDSFDHIKVERGAYNLRRGRDAAGQSRDEQIESSAELTLAPDDAIQSGLKRVMKVKLPKPFQAELALAREGNAYLCNETHYTALSQLYSARRGALREVYFLHIPHAEDGDDAPLSDALAVMIGALLSR